MTTYCKNPCVDLRSATTSLIVALIFLIITFSAIRHQRGSSQNTKPCCIKGYICKAVMNVVK